MEFIIHQEPIAKKRHRHGKHGGYDEQHKEKNSLKWQFGSQMRENGHKRLSRDPLDVAVRCYCSPPKTLSQAKKRALEGQFKTKKPDADPGFHPTQAEDIKEVQPDLKCEKVDQVPGGGHI